MLNLNPACNLDHEEINLLYFPTIVSTLELSMELASGLLLQPVVRPISHEQLVGEVKNIYAALVMVEAKCADIDERRSAVTQERDSSKRPELKNDQWQSLIALHKQLLHDHHDFFLASQHPSANPALSKLAAKYSMPVRMWRDGIHSFLEVLRHRLPESPEHMLACIYITYSMIPLLYETVPVFEDTWIGHLGDLGRYRMAIEDDEPGDREVWSNVAKHWYNKASEKSPDVGRLHHYLAILARPYSLEQLSLYTRALTCVTPFEGAKHSILDLFNPVAQSEKCPKAQGRPLACEVALIRAHGRLFLGDLPNKRWFLDDITECWKQNARLATRLVRSALICRAKASCVAISSISAMFEYAGSLKTVMTPSRGGQHNSRVFWDESVGRQHGLKHTQRGDEPLPEDFVVRGQVYTQNFLSCDEDLPHAKDDEGFLRLEDREHSTWTERVWHHLRGLINFVRLHHQSLERPAN